jgi:hypothetical protein
MQTLFYLAGILTFAVICFGVYKVIKLVEGKLESLVDSAPSTPNFSNLGREVGKGVIEALETRELRLSSEQQAIKHASHIGDGVGSMPVMSSTPNRDRKVHFSSADFYVPEGLSEAEKQTLEQFYGKQ